MFLSGFVMLAIVLNIVFWGGVIWLIVWAVRRFSDPSKQALAVLDERYARGEIDANEYAARRAVLAHRR